MDIICFYFIEDAKSMCLISTQPVHLDKEIKSFGEFKSESLAL